MNKIKISVIGIGYVGLPLALEFGKKYNTIGYDISVDKINSYKNLIDPNGELSKKELKSSKYLKFSSNPNNLKFSDFFVICVPTPVNKHKIPNLSLLKKASRIVSKYIQKGSTVIFEPTVYPGATEEICIPILEKFSKLRWKLDFNVGYSPERINPGDKKHSLTNVVKIVSGDNKKTLKLISNLYKSIIPAGVYESSSIKIAEAAKVIENTQRDLNIALVNELSIIFNEIGIDTQKVLEASSTKWNFIPYKPGLVGGHCIGVDPYYLTYKAKNIGYTPKVILAGRKINDDMPKYISKNLLSKMQDLGINVKKSQITVLGVTFKENCSDLRNSKVLDLIVKLKSYGCKINIHDPMVIASEAKKYGFSLNKWNDINKSEAIILAVPHKEYLKMPLDNILQKLKKNGILLDIKSVISEKKVLQKGFNIWRL